MGQLTDAPATVVVFAKGFPPTPGGVEQYSLQVCAAYRRAGLDVTVITQTQGAPGWSVTGVESDIRVYNVGPGGQLSTFARMCAAAARLRRGVRPAVIHSTTWRVGIVPTLLFPRVRRVLTVHGREILNYPAGVGPLMRNVVRRSDIVMAVSGATRELGASAGMPESSDTWVVSHNGVSWPAMVADRIDWFGGGRPLRVLSLSRLVPRKNHIAALHALHRLRERSGMEFEYRIAGTGSQRAAIEAEIVRLGLQKQVTMLGYVDDDDVPDLYRWADVFAHPHTNEGEGNDFEGFGIVIADAMHFGCVAISGRAGGPSELIQDGTDGYLVDGSRVDDIVTAFERLIAEPRLVEQIGSAASATASRRYSWDTHVEPALALLDSTGTGER